MLTIDEIFKESRERVPDLVKGSWYRVQWTPDISAGERLNLGVAFVSHDGDREVITLDEFSRLRCLFDEQAEYHARLACQVAEVLIETEPDPSKWMTSQLSIVEGGFAQGKSAYEILDRLFNDLVPLSIPKGVREGRRQPIRRNAAYLRIKENLESRLGGYFSQYIPKNPRVKTESGMELYLPFRRGKDNKEAATLVSADYTTTEKIQGELYLGLRDLMMSRDQMGFRKGAMFIVSPGRDMDRHRYVKAEEELKDFSLYLQSCGVPYYQGREIEGLSEMVADWCLGRAA